MSAKRYFISQATMVNEGKQCLTNVLVENGRIAKIDAAMAPPQGVEVIDAQGLHLLPGFIDDQVHFREPGLTAKADIGTESKAAVAGGTTSFMEMPNVKPPTVTIDLLEEKYAIGAQKSWANYSFYFGGTNDNVEEIKKVNPKTVCGVKVFMGSSTGNMLVDQEDALRGIFTHSPTLIATHCEDTPMIKEREAQWLEKFGEDIPAEEHPKIRFHEACYKSSSMAVKLAKETGARLHILHITTADELELFEPGPVKGKQITAEACTHHLWFSDKDYAEKGHFIKCNPAIKTQADRDAVRQALIDGRIDVVATDHAPHLEEEKHNPYFSAPAGLPQVQKSLNVLLDLVAQGVFTLEQVVEKMAHNVADLFEIDGRGYIREGYWADLVLVDLHKPHVDKKEEVLYKCGWSPWEGHEFSNTVVGTFVSGELKYYQGEFAEFSPGQRLLFDR
ncbi:dihydroorotase [Thiosulfatimonas sediminis]|uniref:Dihydroorotase n=1 Tax=Thiosulfatimonas sediminis TaxID=2675054 RepID=A0A6F8PXN2_9GAMM|nr:dihydroorotase [Thiosulfatimonas sediminis]BBP46879.1 dihydroorotase [Thiosulfatimonas sediminis]